MDEITPIHKDGYCAMYGVGGKISFFGADIPSPNNIPAQKLNPTDYNDLVDICGDSWRSIDYACCDSAQLKQLKANLAKADPLIASCPACKENFYQLFCHFTCSPNQSSFINILSTQKAMNKNDVVNELDFYVDPAFASPFYDSCKNIKFGLTNGYAMDLIGGGAKNYSEFLQFLGDKKPELGGSPFQINYKFNEVKNIKNITLFEIDSKLCNDSDPSFSCACSDCPQVCPKLTDLPSQNQCQILNMTCTSFTILISYFLLLLSYFSLLSLIRYRNNRKSKSISLLTDDQAMLESSVFQNDVPPSDIADLSFSSQTTLSLLSLQSRKSYAINNYLEKKFYHLGHFCSSFPKFVLSLTILITLLLSSFIYFIDFETNPINLWVSPNADAYIEKKKFDDSFGSFYRTQQIILSNATGDSILQDYSFIEWWFEKESQLTDLSTIVTFNDIDYSVTYNDICFKPLEDTCIIESFTQYFDGNIINLPKSSDWRSKIEKCATSPVECLPSFQQPIKKNLIFGGNITNVLDAEAIVITLLNNNDGNLNSEQSIKAKAWENELEKFMINNITKEAHNLGINVSFMTEISLEKELNKSTNTDVKIIIISYLVMFAYASYALSLDSNSYNNLSFINSSFITPFGRLPGNNIFLRYLTKTRFSLGLSGILIVLFSVFASMGFWSFMGLKSTLIIAEVIPFLILAVGVDNIFLICNEFSNIENLSITSSLELNEKIGKTMANIGPSILLSSSCQFVCFILGSFVGMPAVKNFSLYVSISIIFNTVLQITTFVSILTLDQLRIQEGKLDLLSFIRIDKNTISLPIDSESEIDNVNNDSLSQMLNKSDINNKGAIKEFFRNKFSPFIFRNEIRSLILLIVLSVFGVSLSLIPNLQLGLDQRIALPSDSYLINYFNDIYSYLEVGPPVFFVVEDLDVTELKNQQGLCSKFTACDSYSVVNIIEQEFKRGNESTIAEPVASWIDDFLMWLNPDLSDCCVIRKNTPNKEFCPPFSSPRLCDSCFANREWDYQMNGFPVGEEFMEFFNAWIDAPSYPCPLGGKAPYSSSIYFLNDTISRSAFRTSHIPLRSQNDFISAYHNSLRIVKEIKEKHENISLFAYSPFYIFFVQYETIKKLTFTLLSIGLLLVGLITMLFLGSVRNSVVLIINLIFIIVDMMAWMVLSNISLNAVSLVNLLICLGLSVEFLIHLFKHFNFNENQLECSKDEYKKSRAYGSLIYVGTTTLSGITFTKLIGIGVLSFTKSKIFRVYYFKMWAGLIIIASIHALVVAPLLLSLFGSDLVYGRSVWGRVGYNDVLRRQRDTF